MDAYVKFIESAGARAVPLIYHGNMTHTLELIDSLNGILYCGGGAEGNYITFGKAIFDKVKTLNDQGQYYPIWGTCLGFEDLAMFAADLDKSVLN